MATKRRNQRASQARRANPEAAVLRQAGERIRYARTGAKLTQEAAAARVGIDYKRWQELERGRVNATLRTLLRVADALETDVWSLFGRRGATRKR